ncbi:MAG: lytic transglycosylase domain-containing protein [Candidatus Sericytochromatia bacterium]|nr:lytic transglycosylase domain-containing protein [Candidatus Tanganyikabacteria bacterium]
MVSATSITALAGAPPAGWRAIAARLAVLLPATMALAFLSALRQDALWTPASMPDRAIVADWREKVNPAYTRLVPPATPNRAAARPPYPYANAIGKVAKRYDLPADLIAGIVYVESRFNPKAVSHKGAIGLMQLLPSTARPLARKLGLKSYDLTDPETNLLLGTFFLKDRLREYDGDINAALSYYNGGRRTMISRGNYRNRGYITSVLRQSRRYAPLAGQLN